MIKIYGASDDLVEIEGSAYKNNEIYCYEQDVRIRFMDGTVIRIGYPKDGIAVWRIEVEADGTAEHTLTICEDEDADIYSDVFEIDSEIKSHRLIKQLLADAINGYEKLESRLAQVEMERDALMNDLLIADRFDCVCCVHRQDNDSCDFECDTCASPCTCFRCRNNNLYEWRGVCDENTKGELNDV